MSEREGELRELFIVLTLVGERPLPVCCLAATPGAGFLYVEAGRCPVSHFFTRVNLSALLFVCPHHVNAELKRKP